MRDVQFFGPGMERTERTEIRVTVPATLVRIFVAQAILLLAILLTLIVR